MLALRDMMETMRTIQSRRVRLSATRPVMGQIISGCRDRGALDGIKVFRNQSSGGEANNDDENRIKEVLDVVPVFLTTPFLFWHFGATPH